MSDNQYPVLIIDNGGHTLKALYIPDLSNLSSHPPRLAVVPNCVGAASFAGRGIVGEQLFKLPHFHGFMLRRPVDRGFVVDAALQSYIWEYLLQYFAIADESDVELLLTVPFAAPKQVGELLHYLVAHRFKFHAVTLVSSTFLALLATASRDWFYSNGNEKDEEKKLNSEIKNNSNYSMEKGGCGMVIDFGFSATTVVPYVDFIPVRDAIVRVDVGGKLLSNRLKELISFTQVNMTEDGWLVNHIMECCCYIEMHPYNALCEAQTQKKRNNNNSGFRYYLPTIQPLMPLGCREEELESFISNEVMETLDKHTLQHITFRHEAFLIPELIFHPADVGIQQMGIVEAILQGTQYRGVLRETPTLHQALLQHIIAFGGTANFKNLRDRLNNELQQEIIKDFNVKYSYDNMTTISTSNDPLQPIVKRCHMAPNAIVGTQSNIGLGRNSNSNTGNIHNNTPCDSELQPLYGALALFTCPQRNSQLEILRRSSRVDLSGMRSVKQSMGRAQTITSQKTQKAILDVLQNLL